MAISAATAATIPSLTRDFSSVFAWLDTCNDRASGSRDMHRDDLQILADARVADADALLIARRWAGAYYLAGYAVECALKACAATRFRQHEVPERKLVDDFHTHRLDVLLRIAGIQNAFDTRVAADRAFSGNWDIVRDWNETARYNHDTTERRARELFAAVTEPSFGVLTWLKTLY